ncbi:MAG: hypothetical protein L3J67_04415 [Hyphomicrobiaceae bacterium]|nr:hypothetical protein [Hyphomicrobiaceae bacterium]
MAQLDAQRVIIQIQGAVEQKKRKEEIASILRMLKFASEEINAFGFVESAKDIRNTMEHLQHQLNGN